MIRVEHAVVIERPIEEVFDFMAKVENLPRWAENTIEARQTSEGPLGAGTTCTVLNKAVRRQMRNHFVVTEDERPTRYAAKTTAGPFPMHLSYAHERVERGTSRRTVSEADLGGILKLGEPLMRRMARKQIEVDHARLKDILESQAASS